MEMYVTRTLRFPLYLGVRVTDRNHNLVVKFKMRLNGYRENNLIMQNSVRFTEYCIWTGLKFNLRLLSDAAMPWILDFN